MPEVGVPGGPDAGPPAVHSARLKRQHRQAHRDDLSRQVVAPVVRIRAGEPPGHLFGRAPLGQMRPHRRPQPRDPRVCAIAAADRLDRGGPAWCGGPTRGSGCWGPVSTPSPSSGANDRGSGPDSRSHGLPHSSVGSSSLAWQHRSPSGPVVLYLELELKLPILFCRMVKTAVQQGRSE